MFVVKDNVDGLDAIEVQNGGFGVDVRRGRCRVVDDDEWEAG